MKPLPTPKEIVQEAIAKGWVALPAVKPCKQRGSRGVSGNTPEKRAEYYRNQRREWNRSHPENVRAWRARYNQKRRINRPSRKRKTGIEISPIENKPLYHRLYMRLWRQRKTVNQN